MPSESYKKRNDPVMRFLFVSFIGVILFSILVFGILSTYMSRKSEKAISNIGEIYMSGMNQQMSGHFETVIGLRFDQVHGITSAVSSDMLEGEALYKELIERPRIRGFGYLALCSEEGVFETLYGKPIQPTNPDPFVEALSQGNQRVAVGLDADGHEVVLFGVDATYPMSSGGCCTGLVAAVPLDYITDFLSLKDSQNLMYYHIIRTDGSFVIQNENQEMLPYFEDLQRFLDPESAPQYGGGEFPAASPCQRPAKGRGVLGWAGN